MRKLLTLVLVGLSIGANARQITPDEAISVASDFMSSSDLQTATSAKSALRPMKAPGVDANSGSSPYYVFNRGENDGFVIISGDDRAPKILGYSDKGSFDSENLPPQLKAMMESWAKQIEGISGGETHSSWTNTMATRAGDEVLLETANWGQDFPYNGQTPIVEGANCPTGCVATAMAIVMKYHNWPETYDWASMPMNTENDPLDYEVFNPTLAKLMADAGESVFMEYSPWESGANMNWVGHKMQQVFKYSPDCQFITSGNFSHEKWISLLNSNLQSGNPVIYNGSGSGNHAFIVDGYNSTGYHINWGWDGWYNGYFALDNLAPNEYQNFSQNVGMVINIVPDKTGKLYSTCYTDGGYFWSTSGAVKMNISVENVRKGEMFSLANSSMTVSSGFQGQIGLALVDKDNNIKEVLGTSDYDSWNNSIGEFEDKGVNFSIFNVSPTVDVEVTDRLQLVSKDNKDSDFRLVLGTMEWPSYIGVTGNKPRFSKLKLKVSEGTEYEYSYGDGYNTVTPGEEEINVLLGVFLGWHGYATNPSDEEILNLVVRGQLIYGEIQSFSDVSHVSSSFDVVGDEYSIETKLVKLVDKNIYLQEAGLLKDLISQIEAPSIKKLTIEGKMNAIDFWHLRKYFSSLTYLDISKVSIEEVVAADGGFFIDPIKNEANFIPEFALSGLENLKEIILPSNLVGISNNSLMALGLSTVTIPSGVEYIGLNVFHDNKKLKVVELLNDEPVSVNDCIFTETQCPENGILYVPVGASEKYRSSPVWQDFKEIIEGNMPIKVNSILLNPDNWSGESGKSFKIEATVLPEDAGNKTIVWTSSDESVATVDGDGIVTTHSVGEAIITAQSNDISGVSAKCRVTVSKLVGDSNGDGIVDVSDAVNIANYILGLDTTDFSYEAADVNGDGRVTISDITSMIALIATQTYGAPSEDGRSYAKGITGGYLMSNSNNGEMKEFSLKSDEAITALQFDLSVSSGDKIPAIKLGDKYMSTHTLREFTTDANTIRVIIYSSESKLLSSKQDEPIITVGDGGSESDLKCSNIFASTTKGQSLNLQFMDMGISNGITGSSIDTSVVVASQGSVTVSNISGQTVCVYSLEGNCLGKYSPACDEIKIPLAKGMYIVTIDNSSHRIIIR